MEKRMNNLDCLIIHTPKLDNYYKPVGQFMWINYMPLGLLGIADYLDRNGIKCRVLHQGVEKMLRGSWRLEDGLAGANPPLVALTLHWHHQSYDVIESCRKIKELRPDAYIVLGGATASFFDEEIVRDYECVDGVISGDGEVPLLGLARKVKAGQKDLAVVPNLTWKDHKGTVVRNKAAYCGDEKTLSGMRFANMELLQNYRTYVDYVSLPFMVVKGISKELNFKMFTVRRRLFPLCVGRGCALNCTWCGGSFTPQKERISRRTKVAWRPYDAVIADIRKALEHGYDAMYTVFDPVPGDQSWFIGLFKRIREEGLAKKMGWMHEATGLTSKEFVDEFAETFSEDYRVIALSPESGNEGVRRRNKGYFFSNKDMMEMLEYITAKNINVEVFFTYGIPGENEELLNDTHKIRAGIVKKYGKKNCLRVLPIEIEPGSPWQLDPEKYGIVTSRRTFADFLKVHSNKDGGAYASLGYYMPGYFRTPLDPKDPEADFVGRMEAIKCRHFCFIQPDSRKTTSPFVGRMLCRAMRIARAVLPGRTLRQGKGER